ncbi:hypothetical protein DPEC_G00065760 [Dallia pectoralis]|uniref:Uncharacterized protein n=1 Tax=Dallia pectoralis TaxID=75939 RepID=A0ACC2H8T0_DALPE|nr:hypothetical protein DPEC_G00065760 [Dallia pectoralis]
MLLLPLSSPYTSLSLHRYPDMFLYFSFLSASSSPPDKSRFLFPTVALGAGGRWATFASTRLLITALYQHDAGNGMWVHLFTHRLRGCAQLASSMAADTYL